MQFLLLQYKKYILLKLRVVYVCVCVCVICVCVCVVCVCVLFVCVCCLCVLFVCVCCLCVCVVCVCVVCVCVCCLCACVLLVCGMVKLMTSWISHDFIIVAMGSQYGIRPSIIIAKCMYVSDMKSMQINLEFLSRTKTWKIKKKK